MQKIMLYIYNIFFTEGKAQYILPNITKHAYNIATNNMQTRAIMPTIFVELENSDNITKIFANKLINYNAIMTLMQRLPN